MAVTWCLTFPYAPNEPIRAEAFEIVQAFYSQHFPNVPQLVHSATPVGEPFLRAQTRNELVRMADSFDVVCLVDADTIVHPDHIRDMVEWVAAAPMRLGKPFYRGVNRSLERQRLMLDSLTPWPRARFGDPGAAWIVRPADWWTAGGMDEAFRSWGGEDESFAYLFAAAGGIERYAEYAAVKTEHDTPRRRSDPEWPATLERQAVCRHVWRNPHLLTEWLQVRHEPGVVAEWIIRHDISLQR